MPSRLVALVLVLVLASVTLAPSFARAQAAPAVPAFAQAPAEEPAPASGLRWYGGKNLGLDLLSVTMVVGAFYVEDDTMAWTVAGAGLATYFIGAPAVHASEGQSGRARASLVLRLGLPVLGGLASAGIFASEWASDGCHDECEVIGPLLVAAGASVGALVAMGIDDFGLAWKRPVARARTWTPSVAPSSGGGVTFGVAGAW